MPGADQVQLHRGAEAKRFVERKASDREVTLNSNCEVYGKQPQNRMHAAGTPPPTRAHQLPKIVQHQSFHVTQRNINSLQRLAQQTR